MFRLPRILIFILSMTLTLTCAVALAGPEALILENAPSAVALKLLSEDAGGCDILFELNELTKETITVDGEAFHALTISGGGISGLDGHPGLPTYSGMIAVPEGYSVKLAITSTMEKEFSGMRVLPVQPDQAETFIIDRAAYSSGSKTGSFTVNLGQPAIYLGQTVAPFTIHPVQYQADQDIINITHRLGIHFEFVADGKGPVSRRAFETVPQSFARLFDDVVVNNPSAVKSATPATGPGTYLVITPSSVQSTIAPLVNWRQRQGYNVLVTPVEVVGPAYDDIKSYIQNIYDTVEPPLEHILLVGDANGSLTCATGTEYLSGWQGETDHYYTTLDGDDILPDAHIGRLTARDPTQLSIIVNKILTYETNPPMTEDPDWFTRATVIGDPDDSGITTIYVNQWLKAQLEQQAFTQVDTIFGGNFPSLMHASLSQGCSIFGYRGFYAMSGYSPGFIALAENRNELPFAVLPTCDTGSFRTHTTAHSEAFLRAANGGAIGAIALSTIGTHTRYNNCLYHGIWEGMLNTDNHQMGSALNRGKLELYNNYYLSEPQSAEIWATWANLMGDPATDIWLDQPSAVEVTHPAALPVGANSVPVTVTSGGSPLEGALVALFKADELRVTAYTDAQGMVNLPMSGQSAGTVMVTVTKHNCLPYLGGVTLGDVDIFAGLTNQELTGGNGDTLVNPGETLQLSCQLTNQGANLAAGVTATLVSRDPNVTVLDGEQSFGDLASGQAAWCQEPFQIVVSGLAPDQHFALLDLVATNGSEEWTSSVSFTVQAPEFSVLETSWNGTVGSPGPDDHGDLVLTISNTGSIAATGMTAVLSTESPWILITNDSCSFNGLAPDQVGDNNFSPFSLQVSSQCYQGHLATFQLTFSLPGGLSRSTVFQMTIGQAASTDPVGPDQYGYYAFDNTDTAYDKAPVYEWVELSPDLGGPGTLVGLTDYAFEADDTRTMDLPFTFQYYGQDFDKVSICSNGWIVMGETSLRHYRNFTIPSAGSPNAMIAPFWDNLYQSYTNQIYYWHDTVNGTYLVQWDNVRNQYGGIQKFQVILRDPTVYSTDTGDGEIVFQYHAVVNNDFQNGYATVGIQNLTGDDGLLYTYWNEYASGAATLEAGRAILFTPTPVVPLATCEASPEFFSLSMTPDQLQEQTLVLSNNGDPESELFYIIEKVDPDAPVMNPSSKSLEGSTLTSSLSIYPVGEVTEVVFSLTNNSPDNEYLDFVSINFPLGVSVLSATGFVNSSIQTLLFNDALGEGALCVWTDGIITSGNTATCTMTLDFSFSSSAVLLPYGISGDGYGADPHSVEGTIVLSPSGPSVTLLSPNGGENLVVDEEFAISFIAGGGPDFLTLDIDRDDGNGWQTIIENIPSADTSVNWLVEGPISAHCTLRLRDSEDPELFDETDSWFSIGRNLGWLVLSQDSGSISSGSFDEITVTINTEGLEPGSYAVDLVVRQMATGALVVPVRLEVSNELSGSPQLPHVTTLEQNHPNPFNPQTEIRFAVKEDGPVKLRIYNAQGRLVRTLVDEVFTRGEHQVLWRGLDDDGRRLSSGMYLYRMETQSGVEVRKMLMVK
jgi:hypothetical protein